MKQTVPSMASHTLNPDQRLRINNLVLKVCGMDSHYCNAVLDQVTCVPVSRGFSKHWTALGMRVNLYGPRFFSC